jgi:hypothetical protein
MNQQEREQFLEQYNERTHLFGRIGLWIGIVLLIGAPFVMGISLDAMPNLSAFGKGLAQIAIIYIPSCIVEFLIYTPMLGAGGSYLAFITGNLINMKIPCALNARDIVGTEAGTTENEIVSTLSIATSSLVTIVVIAIGVVLLLPLQPLLQSPALQPAFDNVVPALFGALAYKYFRGNMKIAALPLVAMGILFTFVPSLASATSFMILPSGGLAIFIAYRFYKKSRGESK